MSGSWSNTFQSSITIPTGATSGQRIVIDGTTGLITVYDASGTAVDIIGGPDGDIVSTDGTSTIVLHSGTILLQFPLNTTDGEISTATDTLLLTSPTTAAFGNDAQLLLQAGPGTATGVTAPDVLVRSSAGGVADLVVQGTVIQADGGGTRAAWQVPAPLAAGWALGSSASPLYQPVQYRLDAENNVIVEGAIRATAAAAAGAYGLFTMPAAYAPAAIHATAGIHASNVDVTKAVIRVNVANTGVVGIYTTAAIAIGDNLYFQIQAPLGQIP